MSGESLVPQNSSLVPQNSSFREPADEKHAVYPQEKWIIHAFYCCEIATINARCYLRSCDAVESGPDRIEWLVLAIGQTIFNALVFAAIFWAQGSRSYFTNLNRAATVIAWSVLIVVNFAEAVREDKYKGLQLLLNFFGYGSLIRFWVTVEQLARTQAQFTTPLCCWSGIEERHVFAAEHILFTSSILLCYFYEVNSCTAHLTTLEVIETQLEFFLLGYLSPLIRI